MMRRSWMMTALAGVAWPMLGHAQQVTPAPAPTPPASPAKAAVPSADAQDEDDVEGAEVVVTANRAQPGAVVGDIPPEVQLSPADIRSYGVSSINDLLTELAPQTTSGRGGRPVILLNGRRISSFSEIRDLPTEAILRVDILPEEVALKYGYSADQKVVNFVLRRRFRSTTVEASDTAATDGGRNTPRGQFGLLNLSPNGRFSLNLDYQTSSRLLESERDITSLAQSGNYDLLGNVTGVGGAEVDPALSALAGQTVTIAGVPTGASTTAPTLAGFAAQANQANVTNLTRYRTLLPATDDFEANLVYARTVFGNVLATANGQVEVTDSSAYQGLPGVTLTLPAGNPFSPFGQDVLVNRYVASGLPLTQNARTITSHGGLTLNGDVGKWRWTATGTYDRVDSETLTDTGVDAGLLQAALNGNDPGVNPYGPLTAPLIGPAAANQAYSTSQTTDINALANGNLFSLPAGDVSTSVRVGAQFNDFDSRSVRNALVQTGSVIRNVQSGQINLDVPIARRSRDVLPFLGDLSLNGNFAINHLSDFGTLTTRGYGANWSPLDGVRILVSHTDDENAPSAQQLGNPQIVTPNVRVFDYVTGQTVDVTQVTGGNPSLRASARHVFKAELNLKPFDKTDLSFVANYVATDVDGFTSGFPSATAAIEAAFPDRFTRDDAGNLIRIDARPVNFDYQRTKLIRVGFNFSQPLKSKLQKQIEAYRNGTGPNPFEGLRPPGGRRGATGEQPSSASTAQQTAGSGRPGSSPPDGGAAPPPGEGNGGSPQGRGAAGGAPGGGRFGGGRFGGRGGQFGGGRLQFAVYDNWYLQDRVGIRAGLPALDLLNGDTLGSGGGQSRHEVEAQAGYVNNGIGARLSANYATATRVNGGAGNTGTLDFASLATFDLRLFADLGGRLDFVRKHPWARGMRVTLSAQNLLNTRQRVTDASGMTPISYQPDYLDPLGRTIRISIRKLFFQRSER